ncbi:MAG: FGGY-family carbohydrate kinase [Spirochaetales bacterium]
MSKDSTLLAVDLGAGSGRVLAGRLRQAPSGNLLEVREVHRFEYPLKTVAGLLRWDSNLIEAEIRKGVALVDADQKVASLGIDSWAVDFVLVDDAGHLLELPRAYRNEHTREQVPVVHQLLGERALYQRSGIQTLHFNTIYQLAAWKAANPESLTRARRFAMMPDWLIHRLGAPLTNETTNASTTQLLDARTRDWDDASLKALGLPRDWFSAPVAPGTVLAPQVSLGHHACALIAPATHDTGSAVAAIPLADEKAAYIATGTWCLIGIESKVPETGAAAQAANFTNEAGVDGTYRFLKNCMGLWLLQQLKATWPGCPDFGPLVAAAADAPPFAALVDADDAAFFQPASMKEELEGWFARSQQKAPPATPGAYARACIEGLVLAFCKTLAEIEAIRGLRLERIHLVGGGCRNTLLCQLTADATGLPVLAGPVEGSALGNLIVQARSLGLVANHREGRALVDRSFPVTAYTPQADRTPWLKAGQQLEDLKKLAAQASEGVSHA